ncbi:MAG: hypothetical protein IJ487_01155 [Ruminococcus sp.]|nr:hypothetical protein [Ruminococcus sp.]
MKLIVSVLFIVIILLTAAISRFYSDTTKTTYDGSAQTEVEKLYDTDPEGNRIFENDEGLFGIIDSSDRIIVAPEWYQLQFCDNGICIAKSRIKNETLSGCIDYEGNIVVPVIYRNIIRHSADGLTFYTAQADSDSSWVVYDKNFTPCFTNSWTGCEFSDKTLTLTDKKGRFTYSADENGLEFSSAVVKGNTLGCDFTLSIDTGTLLDKLYPRLIETVSTVTEKYIEYAFSGDNSTLSGIKASGSLSQIFPGDDRIISKKLTGISKVFLYSTNSTDGEQHFIVSVSADAEITYKSVSGSDTSMNVSCNALIELSGSTENSIRALSASFTPSKLPYPEEEIPPSENENDVGPEKSLR